jgi:hypothetical protein
MSFPKINIIFKSTANKTIQKLSRGVVGLIVKDNESIAGVHTLDSVSEVPKGLSQANLTYVQEAFMGGVKTPRKLVLFVIGGENHTLSTVMSNLEVYKIDYVAFPEAQPQEVTTLVNTVKNLRDTKDKTIKCVVSDNAANHEGVINFVVSDLTIEGKEEPVKAQAYTGRIAGLLAGTPQENSVTFYNLSEVKDIAKRISKNEASQLIEEGKLVLFHDGAKVKIARGVNSLVNLTDDKGDEFKKIKVVDVLDMIKDDIKTTVEDSYIGKVQNNYENKCLLISAINGYFEELEASNILEKGSNKCEIDIDATRSYLKKLGKDVESMKDAELKSANTRDMVFIKASIQVIDSMEKIEFNISLN